MDGETLINMFCAHSDAAGGEHAPLRAEVLGYEWLMYAGKEFNVTYAKAKMALAEMERQGWITATRREKGRKGRPGQYWVLTDEGTEAWTEMEENRDQEQPGLLSRLRKSKAGKIRVMLPCDRDVWKEITALGKSGKISLIVCLEESDE